MKTFDFNEQLEVGDVGESDFKSYYSVLSPVKSKEYAIDFTIKNNKTVELKTDSYDMNDTENFFMEKISDINSGKLGGIFRAKQDNIDFFVYYFLKNKKFFWFHVPQVYDRVQEIIDTKKPHLKTIKNKRWTTHGYALPRVLFQDLVLPL